MRINGTITRPIYVKARELGCVLRTEPHKKMRLCIVHTSNIFRNSLMKWDLTESVL